MAAEKEKLCRDILLINEGGANYTPIKILFCDMEGTLFSKKIKLPSGGISKTIWTAIAERLGPSALNEENRTIERWEKREYTGYLEWMQDTIWIHMKYGLTKEMFDSLIEDIAYYRGVRESFSYLRQSGVKTALLTGGFKQIADKIRTDLVIDHAIASCQYFWDRDGNLSGWNLIPCYGVGKALFLRSIMQDYSLKGIQCAFIGDSEDDIYSAQEVGLSIAFNGSEMLQKQCTYAINQPEGGEDFWEILTLLGLDT